jgi:hypothetical protein
MLAAGNTKITNLLSVTPPWIPEGAHAMTQVVELPPADAGLGPHRHSGPVFGYLLEGLTDPAPRAQGKTIIRVTDNADGCGTSQLSCRGSRPEKLTGGSDSPFLPR